MRRLVVTLLIGFAACNAPPSQTTSVRPASASPSPVLSSSSAPPVTSTQSTPTTTPPEEAVALVVGDFGTGSGAEYEVAESMRLVAVEREPWPCSPQETTSTPTTWSESGIETLRLGG